VITVDLNIKKEVKRLTVPHSLSGQELHLVLPFLDQALSTDLVQNLFDFGSIHLNGRRCGDRTRIVEQEDKIEIFLDGLPFEHFALDENHIVYRDDDILVINKPAGIDSVPTPSRFQGTVYSALLRYLEDPFRRGLKPSIGMMQRLDRDTSGLMVFSIHPRAHKHLSAQFSSRAVKKIYRAIVAGKLPADAGEFRSLLARSRATNLMRSVEKWGQEAITRFQPVNIADDASLVEIDLVTGRSHQIRAHFSESGHPLLGDLRYGGSSLIHGCPVTRQMLHANRLSFIHPVKKTVVSFELPMPKDMQKLAQLLFSS
jgi:23S rRNA pseudouridine1911/1915/1917 synthase